MKCSHQFRADVIGLWDLRRSVHRWSVQILNTSLVVITKLQRVGVTVERTHHCIRFLGVLKAQDMAKLVSSHLQEISALTRTEETMRLR